MYLGSDIYYNVLGQDTCKFNINGSIVSLNNILYVLNIRRNLIYVLIPMQLRDKLKSKTR